MQQHDAVEISEEDIRVEISEEEIREEFYSFWMFKFHDKGFFFIRDWALVLFAPVVVWVVGAAIAALLGVLPTYLGSFLGYEIPLWIFLGFAAYRWFAIHFPRTLSYLCPALECQDSAAFINVIRKWVKKRQSLWTLGAIGLSLLVGAIGFNDVMTWWTISTPALVRSWVATEHSWFFAAWFGFFNVVVLTFIVVSGILGILLSVLIINDLLKLPLRLEYYRRLSAVTSLSVRVGLWTFLACAQIFLVVAIVKVGDTLSHFIIFGSSMILLVAFLASVQPVREAISKAKQRKIAPYEEVLQELSVKIDKVLDSLSEDAAQQEALGKLIEKRKMIEDQIKVIEDIGELPLTWANVLSLVSASLITPTIGVFSESIVEQIKSFLPGQS